MANTKITTNVIADDAITTAKIADDAVGNDQLASGLTLGGNTAATLSTAAQPNITSLGTLSALTISGDLTVDTSTLKVDSTNNRVGIGITNPVHDLHIHKAATGSQSRIQLTNGNTGATNADGYAMAMETDGRVYHWLYENAQMQFATNNTQRMSITAAGAVEIKGTSTTANAQAFITNDNSLLSIGSSVSGSVVKDIQFSSPGAKMYIDGSTGYVGIGTTSPGSFLEVRKTTAGSITGGTSNQGATLTLHHEAQWENGYTGGDFVGALNFSSGDGSTGEGVRAAIKVSVDSYYNSNKMRFYVAANNATTLVERMELDDELTFKGRTGTSPAIEMVNSDSEDINTGRETTLRFKGHRSGGELVTNAQISGHHFGTADDDKGGLIFWTNSGSAGLEEKMRIDESGAITTPKRPCFVAHLAASTAYNSGVNQLNGSGWTSVHVNIGSHFSTSTGKFTAPVAGMYSFTVNLCTTSAAPATTYWSAEIYVNTTRVLGGWNEHTAGYQRTEATYVRYLSVGDTVHAGMENAMNITLLGSNPGVYSRFEGYLLG